MSVLIIDDEDAIRMFLSDALDPFNLKVHQAADCRQGLDIIKNVGNIRVSLVDWKIPGMTGLEMVKEIRDTLKNKDMAIIMVTGMNDLEDVIKALEAGANEYLMKPFTPDMLYDKLKLVGLDLEQAN